MRLQYQPGEKVNSGREVQRCGVTFLQPFTYITDYTGNGIHVPLVAQRLVSYAHTRYILHT